MSLPSANSVAAAALDVRNLSNMLQCPVGMNPLIDAVMLTPCGHTIGEVAAEAIFGRMINDRTEKSMICPTCRQSVRAYYPNYVVRQIAGRILGLTQEQLLTVSGEISGDPDKVDVTPFPGAGATFVLKNGVGWESRGDGRNPFDICRRLDFISETRESLFQDFSLICYGDGAISVEISFSRLNNESREQLKQYFINCGLQCKGLDDVISQGFIMVTNPSERRLLYKILTRNNEISRNLLLEIRNFVGMVTSWRDVIDIQRVPPPIE